MWALRRGANARRTLSCPARVAWVPSGAASGEGLLSERRAIDGVGPSGAGRPYNVTKLAPRSSLVTISTSTVLIVHRSAPIARLVTLFGPAPAAGSPQPSHQKPVVPTQPVPRSSLKTRQPSRLGIHTALTTRVLKTAGCGATRSAPVG